MALSFQMQAKDSVTGAIYTWIADSPDFDGTDYPGPNDPLNIAATQHGATGEGATVADDIAKSAGTTIDRVRGINGVSLETTDTLGTGEVWLKRGGGTKLRRGKPVRPKELDPVDYGVAGDGQTDDADAWQALFDAMPVEGGRVHVYGTSWLSKTVHIAKPIQFIGVGGQDAGADTAVVSQRFDVAPGVTGIIFESSYGGNSAQMSYVDRLDGKSKILVHPSAGGSALGYGLPQYVEGQPARLGDVFVKQSEVSPTRAYRITSITANSGRGPDVLPSIPAFSDTLGATVTVGGITWTTECIPQLRIDSHAYAVKDRVCLMADNRFYYECEGVTGDAKTGASLPTEMLEDKLSGGVEIGSTITDGNVTWRVKHACFIFMRAGLMRMGTINARGFTNAALMVVGGAGQDVIGTTNADNFTIEKVVVNYCGLGVYVQGDDTNGYEIHQAWGLNLGTLQPTPNDVIANGYINGGGHVLHCNSLASGLVRNLYSQLSTGRPILKTGLGIMAAVSCYSETVECFSKNTGGTVTVVGGSISFTNDSAGVLQLGQVDGRGLGESCSTGDTPRKVTLLTRAGNNSKMYQMWVVSNRRTFTGTSGSGTFQVGETIFFPGGGAFGSSTARGVVTSVTGPTSDPEITYTRVAGYADFVYGNAVKGNSSGATCDATTPSGADQGQANVLGWVFNQTTGFYQLQHGAQNLIESLLLGGPMSEGYCGLAGWEHGSFVGTPGAELFTAPYVDITWPQLRAAFRRKGDRFQLEDIDVVCLENGYRGSAPWLADHTWATKYDVWGIAASWIEPTATFGQAGGKVFECTKSGAGGTGGGEPNWATATNVGDTVTDNVAVWTLRGFVPAMSTQKWTTTTNAAGQRIARIPISPSTCTTITVSVQSDKPSTNDAATALLRGTFKRNGTGNALQVTAKGEIAKTGGLAIDDTDTTGVTSGVYFSLGTTYTDVLIDPGENITLVSMVNINREEGKAL